MRPPGPTVAVPPLARARALGALVPPGSHSVAYASEDADGVLTGFALEGLEADERVLVLAGAGPRSIAGRLRANGVAAPSGKPSALRVMDPARMGASLGEFVAAQAAEAVRHGYDGLRLAHLCAPGALREALAGEAQLPRRFPFPLTMLCLYTPQNLGRAPDEEVWKVARHHSRILLL